MQSKQQKPAFIIYGPTAVGKTDLAINLARAVNGVMINCDLGQVYTPLSIGTAKPDLNVLDIPYDLFDIVSTPRAINAAEYVREARSAIDRSYQQNKIPIIVGGSGFYAQSLLFPFKEPEHLRSLSDTRPAYSWQLLNSIDPDRARAIHHHDEYRIKRALDIWYQTGILPSHYKPIYDPFGPCVFVMLTREREDLYTRINQRTEQMLDGWIQEVKDLTPSWQEFVLQKKILGYDDMVHFVRKGDNNAQARQSLYEIIAKKTRNYAKRQLTFGAMMIRTLSAVEPPVPIAHINLTTMTFDDAVFYLTNLIMKLTPSTTSRL